MNFTDALAAATARADSLLCVGLDPDPARLPGDWRGDAARLGDFCAGIVDATHDLACAFKPQIAYFAAHRAEDQLERLIAHIRRVAPDVPVILDAKRGDIGATAEQYAREAFERYRADAVTLSPFMGFDSIEPYLRWEGKGAILLCRTSNPGGDELQGQTLEGGERVYERIARLAAGPWNRGGQLGLVVGATYPAEIARVREIAPTLPLLIPGVVSAWILMAAMFLRELTLSVVLSRPGSEVLAVQILGFADDGLWGKLSALGIIMIVISTLLVLLASLVGARFKAAQGAAG